MKKLYLAALILGSLPAVPLASVQSVGDYPAHTIGHSAEGYVPAEFTSAGKTLMTFGESVDGTGMVCNIFDSKFNNIAKIDLPEERYVFDEYFQTSELAFDYDYELDETFKEEYCGNEAAVTENIRRYFGAIPYKVVQRGGYKYYYPEPGAELSDYPSNMYYEPLHFGTRYPNIAYRCNVATDELHPFKIERLILGPGYRSSKFESQPMEQLFDTLEKYMALSIEDYNSGIKSEIPMFLSQTLFNSDDDFEYLSPIFSSFSTECVLEPLYKEVIHEYVITGFQIKRETGEIIQSVDVDIPDGYTRFYDICLVTVDEDKYIKVTCADGASSINDLKYAHLFYKITPDASTVVRQVGEPIRTSVRPTVVKEGEGVNVNVNVDGVGEKLRLSVTDMGGRTVYSTELEGDGQHVVPGAAMRRGMNVVTVSAEGKEPASTKVLVR